MMIESHFKLLIWSSVTELDQLNSLNFIYGSIDYNRLPGYLGCIYDDYELKTSLYINDDYGLKTLLF